MDFSRLLQVFEKHGVSFVTLPSTSYTTHSIGRLTLNILLSFACQFEREIIQRADQGQDRGAARRKGKFGRRQGRCVAYRPILEHIRRGAN
jgi:site-specific DNA recombinase